MFLLLYNDIYHLLSENNHSELHKTHVKHRQSYLKIEHPICIL